MFFGADERQRPRVHCMGLDWSSHRDADLTERLRPRDPVVTYIRQPVVGLDGWNVGTLCLVDEPDRAPGIVALRIDPHRLLKTFKCRLNVFACGNLGYTHLQSQVRVQGSFLNGQFRDPTVVVLLGLPALPFREVAEVKNVET